MSSNKYKLKGVKKNRSVGHRPRHNKKSVKLRKEIKKREARITRHII